MAGRMLDAGQLTAKLTLQEPIDVSDGQGGVTRTWTDKATLWAALRPLSQQFGDVAGGTEVTALFDIWLYMRRDIAIGMRLSKGARIFSLISQRDADAAGRFLILRCREELS